GVVGQIAMLSSHYAKVLTIIDVNSRIGVKSQRTRVNGVFIGTGINTGEVKYIMKDKDVKVDDLFITSGLDGIFPKGLLVGKVISISEPKTGLFKKIVVKTSVDFCCLEEVIVLLKPSQWFSPHEQN
ncbi:MAG: rod shape-determining protein MreC, partial [Thermodesulfobacteriota bacterium]